MDAEFEAKFRQLGGLVPIGETFAPISEAELSSIENTLVVTFPSDYRLFLVQYGCATFEEYVDFQPLDRLPSHISAEGTGHFAYFYGAESEEANSLSSNIKAFRGRIPGTMIPIGDDGGGNQICLGIRGTALGKVFYWDHEAEADEDENADRDSHEVAATSPATNVYLVAESFGDFIRRLVISKNA